MNLCSSFLYASCEGGIVQNVWNRTGCLMFLPIFFRTNVLLILYLYLIDFSIYFSNIVSISLCALRGSFKIRFKPTRVCPDCYEPLALAILAFNFNILAFLTAKKLFLMMVRTCNHYFFIHSNSTSSLFLDYQTQRV